MTLAFDSSQVKAKFAEFAGRVAHRRERLVVLRRGKPYMALVPLEDLRRLEALDSSQTSSGNEEGGKHPLESVVGLWADSPEMDEIFAEIIRERHNDYGREIPSWD